MLREDSVLEKPPYDFDTQSEPLEVRVSNGLAKIGGAIRSHGWRAAGPLRLTPTQAHVLTLLRGEPRGLRLSVIAAALAVTPPTASDALGSLVRKGLVVRGNDAADRRAAAFALTSMGREVSEDLAAAPDFLARAVDSLAPAEQVDLHLALIKTVRALQEAGDIPIQRMCLSCRYFRPFVRPDDAGKPHVCAFADAPFGDRHLRLDCREQEAATAGQRVELWLAFKAGRAAVAAAQAP